MQPLPPALRATPALGRWLRLTDDRGVVAMTGKVEIGQGLLTALRLIVAEELDVAPDRVYMISAQTGHTPDEGVTAGSQSIETSGAALRQASAWARRLLLERAAAHLGVAVPVSVVVQDFCAIGEEPFRRQGVLDAQLPDEDFQRGPNTLHGHAAATNCGDDEGFGRSDKRNRRQAARTRIECGDDRFADDFSTVTRPPAVPLRPAAHGGVRGIDDARRFGDGVERSLRPQLPRHHVRHSVLALPCSWLLLRLQQRVPENVRGLEHLLVASALFPALVPHSHAIGLTGRSGRGFASRLSLQAGGATR